MASRIIFYHFLLLVRGLPVRGPLTNLDIVNNNWDIFRFGSANSFSMTVVVFYHILA